MEYHQLAVLVGCMGGKVMVSSGWIGTERCVTTLCGHMPVFMAVDVTDSIRTVKAHMYDQGF